MKKFEKPEFNIATYDVETNVDLTIEAIWNSQKNFFLPGSSVTILDENGNSKDFTK